MIQIDDEFKALIPPLANDEYLQLKESILDKGCRDALVLWNDVLVDGHNRHLICTENDIEFKTINHDFDSRNDAKIWMITNQFARRNITSFVRAELALILKPLIAKKAKANQKGGQGGILLPQNSAKANPIETRQELAKQANVSHDTISKTETILKSADNETKEKLRAGDPSISINKAYQEIKRSEKEGEREKKRDENRKKIIENPEVITGIYSTIVIDPPWDWGDEGDNNQLGRARPDYSTMTLSQLKELDVGGFAEENSHIYLWITNRSLQKGFELLEAWGFRYITALTWVKPSYGLGNYFRGQTEHVLFGVKGSQLLKRKDVGTVFHANRGKNGHSSKPNEFYDLVESCSYGPYLEMFSRNNRKDWTTWGKMGKSNVYQFEAQLDFSKGACKDRDIEIIKTMLYGCQSVIEASVEMDKVGVDYIARLRGNAEVYIDAKTRSKGCSKFWGVEPELAIEKWSVLPENGCKGKTGWTLDENKITTMVLYTFDKSDSNNAYLVGFQSLRLASAKNINNWYKTYKVDTQSSGSWKSQAVFVPVSVVFKAIAESQALTIV